MPLWRNKPKSDKGNYHKRRTYEQGKAEIDAAHVMTQRLFCDALRFWRRCMKRSCKRHRRCLGDAHSCFMRGHYRVPPSQRLRAQKIVIAGGARKIAPSTHIEWAVRRVAFRELTSWIFG